MVANGGFEQPAAFAPDLGFVTLRQGDRLGAWEVTAGSVDRTHRNYWLPAGGTWSIDLSGANSAGTIAQDVKTSKGRAYTLTVSLAPNPECGPPIKQLEVEWGAHTSRLFSIPIGTHTRANLGWIRKTMNLVATGSEMRLAFRSLANSSCGPVIDSVTLDSGQVVAPRVSLLFPSVAAGARETVAVTTQPTAYVTVVVSYLGSTHPPVVIGPAHASANGHFLTNITTPADFHGTARVVVVSTGVAQTTFTVQ